MTSTSTKVSALEKLKADRSYLEELKLKSEKERVRRKAGAKKIRDEALQKRLQKEQEAKLEKERLLERQRRQSKVSADVTMSMKKVIDHLTEVKEVVAIDVIFKHLGCKGSKLKLLELLRKSPFVEVRDQAKPIMVKYKSKYDIKSKSEMLDFMFKLWSKPVNTQEGHGAKAEDVADSYLGCDKDIEVLVSQGKFHQVTNPKTQESFLFYPDRGTEAAPLDAQLASIWGETKVGKASDLEQELRECGIAPAAKVFKWRGLLSKKIKKKTQRKPREYRARNVTNVHMPELFQKSQPATFN